MKWSRLSSLDVRWIYVVFLVVLVIPMFRPLGLPMSITPEVRDYANTIESLPPGSVVWIGADYSPGSAAENNPQLAATFRHCMMKGHKVIILELWEQAPDIVRSIVDPIAREMGKVYGVDYVNLGYKPGGGVAVLAMTRDIKTASAGVDISGTKLENFPLMQQVTALQKGQVQLVISINTGSPGYADYLNYVTDPLGIPFLSCPTAGMLTGQMPFYRSKQIRGLLPGLAGAAQYEIWLKQPGDACRQMDAQSLGHLIVLLFVALGNIGYFASRKEKGGASK
ncbi:MAG: hypothetical protein GX784_02715 [Firmicutes bacterium]|nr:hypothetical protein [Candidatus Fermentithermobacillaceae bacterium]